MLISSHRYFQLCRAASVRFLSGLWVEDRHTCVCISHLQWKLFNTWNAVKLRSFSQVIGTEPHGFKFVSLDVSTKSRIDVAFAYQDYDPQWKINQSQSTYLILMVCGSGCYMHTFFSFISLPLG